MQADLYNGQKMVVVVVVAICLNETAKHLVNV